MPIRLRLVLSAYFAAFAAVAFGAGDDAKTTVAPRPSSPSAKCLATLVKAFNKHDPEAVAALWEPQGLLNRSGSDRLEGREAIANAYAELFKQDPQAQLEFQFLSERAVTPDVVRIEGHADVRHSGGEVTRSDVNATLVEHDGNWLIDEVNESETTLPSLAASPFAQLDWLMGRWTGEVPGGEVVNDIRLADNGHYLVRTYRQEEQRATTREGTQIIAWDAEQNAFRSWLFDAGGAFGEGIWYAESPSKWINKLAIVLPNGRRGSLAQVFKLSGDGKIEIQSIDRSVDGAPQPNSPAVSMVRAQ